LWNCSPPACFTQCSGFSHDWNFFRGARWIFNALLIAGTYIDHFHPAAFHHAGGFGGGTAPSKATGKRLLHRALALLLVSARIGLSVRKAKIAFGAIREFEEPQVWSITQPERTNRPKSTREMKLASLQARERPPDAARAWNDREFSNAWKSSSNLDGGAYAGLSRRKDLER